MPVKFLVLGLGGVCGFLWEGGSTNFILWVRGFF